MMQPLLSPEGRPRHIWRWTVINAYQQADSVFHLYSFLCERIYCIFTVYISSFCVIQLYDQLFAINSLCVWYLFLYSVHLHQFSSLSMSGYPNYVKLAIVPLAIWTFSKNVNIISLWGHRNWLQFPECYTRSIWYLSFCNGESHEFSPATYTWLWNFKYYLFLY